MNWLLSRSRAALRDALEPIRNEYDLIILDCPPALDLLTLNVLVAADTLIVPMQAEYFALRESPSWSRRWSGFVRHSTLTVTIEGVLLTMYDDRTNLAQQVTETLREYFRERLFPTVIPRNVRLAEAPSHGKPVALYDPSSEGPRPTSSWQGSSWPAMGSRFRSNGSPEKWVRPGRRPAVHSWPYS